MRLIGLTAALVVMELGWLALWPLGAVLTHSPAFTASMLARLPVSIGSPLEAPLGDPAYVTPVVELAVVLLAIAVAYLGALVLVSRWRVSPLLIVAAAVAFQLTLLALPGLFSQDVFSYIAYGRLSVSYDLNPYVWPPSAIAKDPVVNWVADVWRTYAAPYGPLWLDVQWLMARAFGQMPVADQALIYRGLSNVLLLVNLGLVWRITRSTTSLAALAWNPLMLFEVGANAHNDALMVTCTLVGLLALVRERRSFAVAGFALGALVKYLSALGVAWLALAELARAAPWRERLVRLSAFGVVVVALTVLAAWPWLELPDSLEPLLNETAGVGYVNAIPDNLVIALASTAHLPSDTARALERTLVVVIFALYLLWEARGVLEAPTGEAVRRATARSLLVYLLLVSTSVQTWYLCLPVALAAVLGWRSRLARVTIGYSLLALPALYLRYYLRELTPVWIDPLYAGVPLLWLALVGLRARARANEPAAFDIRHDHDGPERHRLPGAIVEQLRR